MKQRYSFCFDDVPFPWPAGFVTTLDRSVNIDCDTHKACVDAYTLEEAQTKLSEVCQTNFAELPSEVHHLYTDLPAYNGPLKAI